MRLDRLFTRAIAAALAVPAGGACTSLESSTTDRFTYPPECSQAASYTVVFDGSIEDGDALDPVALRPYCLTVCADAGDASFTPGCTCRLDYGCSLANAGAMQCVRRYDCPGGGGRKTRGATFAAATHLASLAALERASVPAFSTLRRELRAHRAPSSLLRACSRARRDEIRHARAMSALARRAGELVPPVEVTPIATRTLEAIAIENVVEGCVRETYGALVATWQARHAADREVATVMKRIAAEEAQHAALAWRVHRWIAPRLDRAARARVAEARAAALVALAADVAREPEAQSRRALGLPGARQAQAMVATLAAA